MRFLYFTKHFLPRKAGSEIYAHRLCKALKAAGHDVAVVCSTTHATERLADIVYNHDGGYNEYRRVRPNRLKPKEFIDTFKPDFVLVQSDWSEKVIKTCHMLGIPVGVVLHGHYSCERSVPVALRNAVSLWVANSNDTLEYGVKCGMARDRMVVVNPIIDFDKCVVEGIEPSQNQMITLVNLTKEKGGRVLNDVASQLPCKSFLGVNGGYGIQEKIIAPNVVISETVDDMKTVYKRTRILLMPSHFESFGMAAVEAQSNGIPVVASDLPALRDSLGEGAIFVGAKGSWAKAIKSLDDPKVYAALSKKALANAERYNDASKQIKGFVDTCGKIKPIAVSVVKSVPVVVTPAPKPMPVQAVKFKSGLEQGFKKNQLLSVIMAAYKAEKFIAEAAYSILNQELPDNWTMELWIAADGCDASLVEAKKIARLDSRVHVIEIHENVGTYIAANTLLKHCKGDAIFRMDADDVLLQTAMKKMLTRLDTDPEIMTTNVSRIRVDANLIEIDRPAHVADGVRMYRRKVFDLIGYYKPWRCGADSDILIRLKGHGCKVDLIKDFLFCHRKHGNNLTETELMTSKFNECSPNRQYAMSEIKKLRIFIRRGGKPPFVNPVIADKYSIIDTPINKTKLRGKIMPKQNAKHIKFIAYSDGDSFVISSNMDIPIKVDDPRLTIVSNGPISLMQNKLIFNYIPKNLHPDILAMICYFTFGPFIPDGSTVEFPESVSAGLHDIIREMEDICARDIKIVNASAFISANECNNDGEIVISFGGGMDSVALTCLWPDAIPVNAYGFDYNGKKNPFANYGKFIETVISETPNAISVMTNLRSGINDLRVGRGWAYPSWMYLPALLVAGDIGASCILYGDIFDLDLDKSAGGMIKTRRALNSMESAFNYIGVPLISASEGISENFSAKILYENGRLHRTEYCQRGGGNCGKCHKCIRKNMLIRRYDQTHHIDWNAYVESGHVKSALKGRHLYFIHSFSSLLPFMSDAPDWLYKIVGNRPSLDNELHKVWVDRYYRFKGFKMYDEIVSKMLKHGKPMSLEDIDRMNYFSINHH